MSGASPLRIFTEDPLDRAGDLIVPSREERHHLTVRRAVAGQPIEVLDGQGRVGYGRLTEAGAVALERRERIDPPSELMLLVGVADRDRFLWLVEKSVEFGVTSLVPVETERSRPVATRIRGEHLVKLKRRAREALKQSGGAWGLAIHPITDLGSAVRLVGAERRWLADPRGIPPEIKPGGVSVAAAVGPEGGFTESEVELLSAAGFTPTRLGLRTLRFETAALAAAMIVRLEGRERDG